MASQHIPASNNVSRPTFETLPAEVRWMIYGHVINDFLGPHRWEGAGGPNSLAIMHTNRMIHSEFKLALGRSIDINIKIDDNHHIPYLIYIGNRDLPRGGLPDITQSFCVLFPNTYRVRSIKFYVDIKYRDTPDQMTNLRSYVARAIEALREMPSIRTLYLKPACGMNTWDSVFGEGHGRDSLFDHFIELWEMFETLPNAQNVIIRPFWAKNYLDNNDEKKQKLMEVKQKLGDTSGTDGYWQKGWAWEQGLRAFAEELGM